MADFWLATFATDLALQQSTVESSPAAPILAAGARMLAIEVLRGKDDLDNFAVLISAADDLENPTELVSLVGFTNAAKGCNVWRDRGFPLIDATIRYEEKSGKVEVFSPRFGDQPPMQYQALMLALTGVRFEQSVDANSKQYPTPRYKQVLEAPDGAQPDVLITRQGVTWTPTRSKAGPLKQAKVWLEVPDSRYPSLRPLKSGDLTLASAWSGEAGLPENPEKKRGDVLNRVGRADTFGVPAFRFEDVEVLGFRIDLGTYGRDFGQELAELIEPLNFHLRESAGGAAGAAGKVIPDFRYRAATRTLVIELLRYGRMKQKAPTQPLVLEDYQSQHELVVRLLVGRVDDDSAQAHAAAVYVPAIFVDNPWSKTLGRDVQGFDKRMASFCVLKDGRYAPLLPDGRLAAADDRPMPLGEISHIGLVDTTGTTLGAKLVELDCAPANYADWDAFESVDLDLALGSSSLAAMRWRRSDFDDAEFRRSFARSAVAESAKGFRSIQVSPVASRGDLEPTWITGKFTIDEDIRIARPSGVASLRLYAAEREKGTPYPSGSKYWNLLCKMLGDEGAGADVSLPTGSWYRLICSMDLIIDDGLDWGPNG